MVASEEPAPSPAAPGPIVFAYDGCELAELAITEAATQLAPGREALVVCVWQPADVGFVPVGGRQFDATKASEVRQAAQETAAHGASLAQQAGFDARGAEVQAAPTWKGILRVATEHDASLIVLGSHRRSGIGGRLLGSVAGAVVSHTDRSVLVVRRER